MFKAAVKCATIAILPTYVFKLKRIAHAESSIKRSEMGVMDHVVILPGTASSALTASVCAILNVEQGKINTARFSDGEVYPKIEESIRGKHVFVIQTCAAPVNDNIMELILTITAIRRADAASVTAVIPYFGYKFHQRGLPISTALHSRFLWSAAGDFAKMLQTAGVDNIISVDLQRPGQGHEACLFDSQIPVETISANDNFVKYFADHCNLQSPVVVVSPNTECIKKARKFQKKLKASTGIEDVGYAAFIHSNPCSGNKVSLKAESSEFLGDVNGADVVIVDDMVDTAGSLYTLCGRLKKGGARRVFVCASHGLFSNESMKLIDLSPVEKVVVSDSIPLPPRCSSKIVQISIAPLLARVIAAEAIAAIDPSMTDSHEDDEEFELD